MVCQEAGRRSLSTLVAEVVSAREVARELIVLRQLLMEIGIAPVVLMPVHVGNQAAISQIDG